MARERNPERDKARRIWLDSGGTLTARQVAEQVGVKPEQVRKWKSLDSWAAELEAQKPPRKRGGQPGNKNAAGAGAPHGNRNAETHGAYSTVRLADLPDEQREYIESITLDTGTNMLSELQLLIAKEADLQSKRTATRTRCILTALLKCVRQRVRSVWSNSKRNWKPCAVSVMT